MWFPNFFYFYHKFFNFFLYIYNAILKRLEPRFKGPKTGLDIDHFRGYIGKLAGNYINFRFELIETAFERIEAAFELVEARVVFVTFVQ